MGRCALCRIGFWRTAIRLFAGFLPDQLSAQQWACLQPDGEPPGAAVSHPMTWVARSSALFARVGAGERKFSAPMLRTPTPKIHSAGGAHTGLAKFL
jgi:hypothetical protein